MTDKLLGIFLILLGLYFMLQYKNLGREAIEEKKKINKYIPLFGKNAFGGSTVKTNQIFTLIGGILVTLIGIATFLGKT